MRNQPFGLLALSKSPAGLSHLLAALLGLFPTAVRMSLPTHIDALPTNVLEQSASRKFRTSGRT